MSLTAAIDKCINGEVEDCKSVGAILAYAKVTSISK